MKAIDLFAGLGGLSAGASAAGCNVIWAANHWPTAVDWYTRNHPGVTVACQDVEQQNWAEVPAHDLLLAAPACQGHSRARGVERPHHDALRSTAWAVVSAAEYHRPSFLIVENVPEFADWALCPAWCAALNALGYALSPMIRDAADHGVPQNRLRLFIVGTRSRHPVQLDLPNRPHRSVASIVNLQSGSWSPIDKPGRSRNTLARIHAGRRRFGDLFVAPYYGSGSGETGRCITRPLGTVTTVDRWSLIHGDRMRMLTTNEYRAAMGFPDWYALPASRRAAIHMLGNAVCPPVAADLIGCLRRVA